VHIAQVDRRADVSLPVLCTHAAGGPASQRMDPGYQLASRLAGGSGIPSAAGAGGTPPQQLISGTTAILAVPVEATFAHGPPPRSTTYTQTWLGSTHVLLLLQGGVDHTAPGILDMKAAGGEGC
jgi:hypothetical protein